MKRFMIRAAAAIAILALLPGRPALSAEDGSPTFDDVARAFTIRGLDVLSSESPETEPSRTEAPVVAPIEIEMLAVPLPSREPGRALVPVVLEVPSSGLLGDRLTGQLEGGVQIVATRQGREAAKIETTFSVELSVDDPLVRTGLKLYGELLLEAGEHRITALLVNSDTGARGQTATTLEVPETFDDPTLQPLVAEAANRWRVFRVGEATGEPFPFRTAEGDAYLPEVLPRIPADRTSRLRLLGFGIPGGFGAIAGRLVDSETGRRVPVEVTVDSEAPREIAGQMAGAALLSGPGVPPGRYWLELDRDGAPSSRRILVKIVGGEVGVSDVVAEVEDGEDLAGDLEPKELEHRYRGILEALRTHTMPASARDLADLETAATSQENPDRQMKTLSKIEEDVLRELGRSSSGALLPALYLHVLLDAEYIRRGDAWRMGHHRFRLESFVELYVRRTRSDPERTLAAKVLALVGRPQAALEVDPREELALLQLGMAAERQGRHHQARDYFRRLVEVRPSQAHGRLRLAIALRRTGDRAGARRHLSRVTRGGGPSWVRTLAYQELAELELEAKRTGAAIRLLRRGLETLDDQALHLQLAYYLDRRGQRSEASAVLNAMSVEPRTDETAPRYRYNMQPEAEKAAALGALASAVTTHLPDLRMAVATTDPDGTRGSR